MEVRSIAIVGCRNANERRVLSWLEKAWHDRSHCFWLRDKREFRIVTGDAKGADAAAWRFAINQTLHAVAFTADWENLGRSAGPIRNARIVEHADEMIAFWDGESRGTRDSISKAIDKGIHVHIVSLESLR